jgi:thiol:disulfide interchange protein DsbC
MRSINHFFMRAAILVSALIQAVWVTAAASQTNQAMLAKLKALYPAVTITDVLPSPIPGLFEIRMGKNVAFTNDEGRYLLFGAIFDSITKTVLTQLPAVSDDASTANVSFPSEYLSQSIRTVRGDGSRVIAVFSDPKCAYCKQLEAELKKLNNVTIYTFLFPVLGEESAKIASQVWCANNRENAWLGYMSTGKVASGRACDNPIQKNLTLGQRLGIQGTPMIIASSGAAQAGFKTARELDGWLNDIGSTSQTKAQQ